MQTVTRSPFTSVKTEGGLLPADLLQRIADGDNLPGLRPVDYHLYAGERINEAVNRAWNRCTGAWKGFQEQSEKLPTTDSGTTLTRERWLLVLFQELGFGRLPALRGGLTVGDTSFPISHLWQATPIHLVTFRQGLDQRSEVSTALKRSPHSLMQEFLNRSPEYQWGVIANGLSLRILRDNASLRRAAYVEFDLASIMQYELYAEFALLWMVCQQSRFEKLETERLEIERPESEGEEETESPISQSPVSHDSWLERWSKLAAEQGTRAMDALRDGVKDAVEALGSGFLAHRDNGALRDKLREGVLRADSFYHQLRRMVYRLIFLAVAEDRDLLLLPETNADIKQLYNDHYSLRRLRTMSAVLRGGPHPDLHRQLRLLFVLVREGYPALGLPGLGSFLFSDRSTPDLDNLELANQHLLAALRALSFTVEGRVRRAVDFRNLDSEELGSIYQSLLELHPAVNLDAATFVLNQGAGSERKTTGSHYTPTPLVESLLDTALEPVVADRLLKAEEQWRQGSARTPEKLRQAQDDAILSIKVLDGATGSGHMLIGAGRRLARHLARIRTGDDEPSPADLRSAMRDVVRHCLYGVDLNDMAVELCKVALWMESLEPGRPLSFLDAHIQCGNSLIGVTPGLDISEIPDDAFQPVTGDDKATATGLRRRNKKERERKQFSLLYDSAAGETPEELERWRAAQMAKLENAAEEAVTQVREKEIAYDAYLGSDQYETAKLQLDLWTAAFFWPIPAGNPEHMLAPTQNALEHVRAGQRLDATLERQVQEIADRRRFFHWALQFPEVFQRENGGFDVELMNPPWERIKLQEKEWFAARSPVIAGAPNAAARKRMIAALEQDDPALWRAFQDDVRGAESESQFIRNSDHYPLCGRGDVNTYTVFAELARQVLSEQGYVGIIVPTGIASDYGTRFFFQDIMAKKSIKSLYSFENEDFIFPGVHHAYKFCLLVLSGQQIRIENAEFLFFARNIDDLADNNRRFSLNQAEISLINPNSGTCPTFRTRRDAQIAKSIYRRIQVLDREMEYDRHNAGSDGTPQLWRYRFFTMFHMAGDSNLFQTAAQLESSGHLLSGNTFYDGNGARFVPLYEAKMFHFYDHRFGTYYGQTDAQANQGKLPEVLSSEHTNPGFQVQPRYWVPNDEVEVRLDKNCAWGWYIAFRNIARSTDSRTAIGSVLPRVGLGHTASISDVSLDGPSYGACFLANINAFAFDYLVRQKVGGISLGYFILKQIPFISPDEYHNQLQFVAQRVLELTYTAWDLQPFAHDCGYDGPPFRWDEDRRFLLRCELDAAYFHLYGIARDDVDYIMETFPIVKRKDIARHGVNLHP